MVVFVVKSGDKKNLRYVIRGVVLLLMTVKTMVFFDLK